MKAKHPAFISPNAGSIRIALSTVNGSPPNPGVPDTVAGLTTTSPNCTTDPSGTTCTVSAAAVVGTDVYALSLYQSTDGSGTPIGTAAASAGVLQGTTANVSVTFGGVPSSLVVSNSALSAPADGSTHTLTFTVKALDATGATIVPPGNYATPIALTISGDPNSALSLGSANVTAPANADGTTTVTLTYDTSKALATGTIALAAGSPTASVAVSPLVYTPTTTMRMFAGQTADTLQVSEAGYAGAFTVGGAGTLVTTACVPASCTPASAGGSVTITVTPLSAGTGTVTVADANSATASVAYSIVSATPLLMGGPATSATWQMYASGSDVYAGSPSELYAFDASVCTTLCGAATTTGSGNAAGGGFVAVGGGALYVGDGAAVTWVAGPCPTTCSQTTVVTPTAYAISSIVMGADGNLWMTFPGIRLIASFNPLTYVVNQYTTLTTVGYAVAAPDGTIWLGNNGNTTVNRFDPTACTSTACTFTNFGLGHLISYAGVDSAGNVWVGGRGSGIDKFVCAPTCVDTHYTVTGVGSVNGVAGLSNGLLYVQNLSSTNIIDVNRCSATACTALIGGGGATGGATHAVYAAGAVWTITTTGSLYSLPLP